MMNVLDFFNENERKKEYTRMYDTKREESTCLKKERSLKYYWIKCN